jgi:protein O-GlcNAc transferase
MLQGFFLWPDQCSPDPLCDPLAEAARLLRLQDFRQAEARLLSLLQAQPNHISALELLVFLRLRMAQLNECITLLGKLDSLSSAQTRPALHFLQAQYDLQTSSIPRLAGYPATFWDERQFWPLSLARSALLIQLNQLDHASDCLSAIPSFWQDCLEVIRLRCRILERKERYQEAFDLLMPAVLRFPQHLPAQVHLVDLSIKARSREYTLPCLRQALAAHGVAPEILRLVVHIHLLRDRVADARCFALRERVWNSVQRAPSILATSLYNCYDRLGYCEWLSCQPFSGSNADLFSLEMRANRIMQEASQESDITPRTIASVLGEYRQQLDLLSANADLSFVPGNRSPKQLTVAWITADLAYHPVSRFLLGFFSSVAGQELRHRHCLVDTCDHLGESSRGYFEDLSGLEVANLSCRQLPEQLSQIRSLQADVVVDLSGWTGGHFMRGFLARLAPLQITYLGYFASTGLPTMDVWLGDHHLFPTPMMEWHTEAIHRLNRCFIAWQPPEPLPEAGVDVAEAGSAGGIRFGSFNHNRKLSDATLRLWGELLASLPGSSLVLKASHRDDADTQALLCRRMRRQGLDPARVVWLPRADGAVEHLRQYGLVDVALDCFPNGGCTTTCEALWMGTPVITLTGRSYVSRMSTAVLHGAGMGEWCAPSPQHYLELARNQADRLSWLRQHRPHWRNQLQTHPLGDAAGLMHQLELTFSALAAASR